MLSFFLDEQVELSSLPEFLRSLLFAGKRERKNKTPDGLIGFTRGETTTREQKPEISFRYYVILQTFLQKLSRQQQRNCNEGEKMENVNNLLSSVEQKSLLNPDFFSSLYPVCARRAAHIQDVSKPSI